MLARGSPEGLTLMAKEIQVERFSQRLLRA